jgi:hypothetical protein
VLNNIQKTTQTGKVTEDDPTSGRTVEYTVFYQETIPEDLNNVK